MLKNAKWITAPIDTGVAASTFKKSVNLMLEKGKILLKKQ